MKRTVKIDLMIKDTALIGVSPDNPFHPSSCYVAH